MNSFHILPDDTVIVRVQSGGQKWQMNAKALDLWKMFDASDHVAFSEIAPNGMPEHIARVFWYTYVELETQMIQRDVFPWGIEPKSEAFRVNWNNKNKP